MKLKLEQLEKVEEPSNTIEQKVKDQVVNNPWLLAGSIASIVGLGFLIYRSKTTPLAPPEPQATFQPKPKSEILDME